MIDRLKIEDCVPGAWRMRSESTKHSQALPEELKHHGFRVIAHRDGARVLSLGELARLDQIKESGRAPVRGGWIASHCK
jgi:hypothetical protein